MQAFSYRTFRARVVAIKIDFLFIFFVDNSIVTIIGLRDLNTRDIFVELSYKTLDKIFIILGHYFIEIV